MAKLLGAEDPRLTPTYCPGTNGYMSPEALTEPPSYTTKLDIFSCGVLFVQLITRKFPNPGPRTYTVEVKNDPRFPKGRILVEVPELERRKDHLDLVPPTHPLLEVALDCLKDEGPRPTAEQLCSCLIALKESCAYQDSLQQTPGEPPPPARGEVEMEQQLRESEERVEDLTRQVQQLQLQKDELVQELQVSRHDNEQVVAALQQSVEQKDEALRAKDRAKELALQAKDEVLREKNKLLQEKERQIRDLQQSVGRKEMVSTGPLRLEWREGPRTPVATYGESVAVSGGIVYCCDGVSYTKVQMYSSETEQWTVLPECPTEYFSIAIVNGVLTAIGGEYKGRATKTLLSLPHSQQDISQQKWIKQFPPMNYCHNTPVVTTANTSLIVAGGWGPDKAKAPVEVMDTQTLQWSTVARLPHPLSQATATICGSRLYIGGGCNDVWIKSVLMCELSDLLQPPESPAARLGLSHTSGVWREVAELPVVRVSLVTFQGQLLAVGGGVTDRNADTTSEVRQYDAATNSWTVISQMRVRRLACFTAVLPSNRLMVCGGLTPQGRTDRVEMAAVV